jgi:MFS family permease
MPVPVNTVAVTQDKREQAGVESPATTVPVENGKPSGPPRVGQGQGGLAVLRVLRHREFAVFWGGQAISMIGTWMQTFAQGWVVTDLTKTAFALGLVNFLMALPTLLLMPIGGVLADRVERRQILIYTQLLMLVLAAIMGVLVATQRLELWHVYLIAIPTGVATALELPAYQSFYPQLVEKEDLSQAISLNQSTFHGARIIGPALASVFVAAWGTAAAFFANAASFVVVIGSLLLIRRRPPASSDRKSSAKNFMAEGFRYVKERPELQSLLGMTGVTTMFIFPNLAVLMPFYAKHVLLTGADGLGWIMGISGGGSLIGAIMLLSVPAEARFRRIVLCTLTILLTISALAWANHLWVAVVACGIQSFAIAHSLGLVSIIIQEEVPDQLRGRVMSLYMLSFSGVMPFATLLITAVADAIGMRVELQAAGILYAVGTAVLLLRLRGHYSPPTPGEAHAQA